MTKLFSDDISVTIDGSGGAIDSFGRQRVSNPLSLFSDKGYIDDTLRWDREITGGGSIDTTDSLITSEIQLKCGTASGDKVVRQTYQRMLYQPSKSLQLLFSFVMEPKANNRQRLGYFDENNGIYLEANGTTINWVLRAGNSGSVVNTAIPQSSWNIDKMDGTGDSGITLDFTKAHLIYIDMEWLGVGVIRCGFVFNGQIYYTHVFQSGNVLSGTYNASATCPVRFEIENTGVTASATTLKSICQSVVSEGGSIDTGFARSADTENSPVTVGATFLPIMSLRIGASFTYSQLEVALFALFSTANKAIIGRLIWNGTLTGASFTAVGGSSIAEIDTSATAITGGTQIATIYTSGSTGNALKTDTAQSIAGFGIDGTSDIVTVQARSLGGTATVLAAIDWVERY